MRWRGCASRSRTGGWSMTRAVGSVEFPARFTLVAAANPCPCGFDGDHRRQCRCRADRVELVPPEAVGSAARPDRPAAAGASAHQGRADGCGRPGSRPIVVRDRVQRARERQRARWSALGVACNAHLPGPVARRQVHMGPQAEELLGRCGRAHGAHRSRVRPGAEGRADGRRPRGRPDGSTAGHMAEALAYRDGVRWRGARPCRLNSIREPVPDAPTSRVGSPRDSGRARRSARRPWCSSRCSGSRPKRLHALAWAEGTASGCLAAIRSGAAGSQADGAFARAADPSSIAADAAALGARFVTPADAEYVRPLLDLLADPPVGLFVKGRPLTGMRRRRGGRRRPQLFVTRQRDGHGHRLGAGVAPAPAW